MVVAELVMMVLDLPSDLFRCGAGHIWDIYANTCNFEPGVADIQSAQWSNCRVLRTATRGRCSNGNNFSSSASKILIIILSLTALLVAITLKLVLSVAINISPKKVHVA